MSLKREETIEEINGIKYKVVHDVTTYDDPPDENGFAKEPLMVEISREEIKSDKDKIAELEARILVLESK